MPGMSSGLKTNNSTVVAAFHSALLRQGLVVLLVVAVAGVTLNILRSLQLHRAMRPGVAETGEAAPRTVPVPEASARRLLRLGFGLLWLFDGILQGQASMPLGLVPNAVQPGAASSPTWVQHVVTAGATVWSYHPVQAAAASVWIQVGIGLWLLVVPRGRWSQAGGAASAAWGLVVWIFGESFGAIFAPGLTWLFGAPGAVLFYVVAGALVALPPRAWRTPRLGQWLLRALGAFFAGMAVLQAWPGRGFWDGRTAGGGSGTLTGMVRAMAQTPQPHLFASWVRAFAAFDASHGWGVNLFVVIVLAASGLAMASARREVVLAGVGLAVVVGLADWILVEDVGFFGGVGTDPNSMLPLLALCVAGYVALTQPVAVPEGVVPLAPAAPPAWAGTRRARLVADPGYAFRCMAGLASLAIVAVGAVPMAVAAASPNADPLLATAVDGPAGHLNYPAPPFSLVDQHGRPVSLSSLSGKTVALTFLDPVCVSDCPIIAQEFRAADQMLGASTAGRVVMVAVDTNVRFTTPDYLRAFDRQEGMDGLSNWIYLTGPVRHLRPIWNAYDIEDSVAPGGAMVAHSDFAYVISPTGRMRYVLNSDPGAATAATKSSFAVTLANAITAVAG
jgi:cytochrome oxidase Cu insertion factor (SCO1/SenC/PrrC family)